MIFFLGCNGLFFIQNPRSVLPSAARVIVNIEESYNNSNLHFKTFFSQN